MKTISKFALAVFATLTLVASVAQADNVHRRGGPGVVLGNQHTCSMPLPKESQMD